MFPNMSGRGWNKDVGTGHAVEFLLQCQGAKVPEAMRSAKFTLEESLDTTKQMAVHSASENAADGKRIALPPNLVDVPTAASTVSPMTLQSAAAQPPIQCNSIVDDGQ